MAETMNHARRVGLGLTAPTTLQVEFLTCTLGKQGQHVQSDGIRGQRERQSESVVEGIDDVGGELSLEPRVDNLETLLRIVLGGTPSGGVILPAAALPTFVVDVDKGQDVFRYAGCVVDTLTIRSSVNTPLQFSYNIVGTTEVGSTTFPSIANTLSALQPFIHHQLVATIDDVARKVANLEVTIANAVLRDRYYNSKTRLSAPPQDFIVSVSADLPFTADEADLYNVPVAGMPGGLVWTSGSTSLDLAFGAMQKPVLSPPISGRNGETVQRLTFQSRRLSTTPSITATVTTE